MEVELEVNMGLDSGHSPAFSNNSHEMSVRLSETNLRGLVVAESPQLRDLGKVSHGTFQDGPKWL